MDDPRRGGMQNFTLFPRGDFGLVPKEGGNENFRLGNFFLYFGHFSFLAATLLYMWHMLASPSVCLGHGEELIRFGGLGGVNF